MNDIEKEFIPYQQSIDMKTLGFNRPCFGTYHNEDYLDLDLARYNSDYCVLAPTFSQAFRWIREKYNLISSVMDFIDDVTGIEWDYSITIIGTDIDEKGEYIPLIDYSVDDPNRKYKTYEEVELACLIKLIELAKSGSLKA
jgi:hypothetical protein